MYRPGPRRRRPRTWEKSGSSDVCCRAPVSRGRTIGLSTYVWAFGHIVLASDAAALSRPNGSALLGANSPCGSSVVAGESAQGAPSPIVVMRSSWRRAVIPAASARGAVGPCVTSRLARTCDRDDAEG